MDIRTIGDYLIKTGLKPEETFSKEEADKIMNEHVISYYKGRVHLTEDKTFSGYEIADKLHIIEEHFVTSFEKAVEEMEREDEGK